MHYELGLGCEHEQKQKLVFLNQNKDKSTCQVSSLLDSPYIKKNLTMRAPESWVRWVYGFVGLWVCGFGRFGGFSGFVGLVDLVGLVGLVGSVVLWVCGPSQFKVLATIFG